MYVVHVVNWPLSVTPPQEAVYVLYYVLHQKW